MNFVLRAALLLAGSAMLFSCSDSDNPEKIKNDFSQLVTPEMAGEAGKYKITDAASPYSSIELTESGRYVILPSYYVMSAASQPSSKTKSIRGIKSMLTCQPASRANSNGILAGKYTKKGEGIYTLDGFGTISVVGSTQEAITLFIELEDGSEMNVGAQKESVVDTDDATMALCRSWKTETFRMKTSLNGMVITDRTGSVDNLDALAKQMATDIYNFAKAHGLIDDDEEIEDYTPELPDVAEEAIFTKAGSYLLFLDDIISVNIWRWTDKNSLKLRYSHDITNLNNPDYSNDCELAFGNGKLTAYEYYTASDSEDGMMMTVKTEVWNTFSELK